MFPAFEQLLFFISANKNASKLRAYMDLMDIPRARRALTPWNLNWNRRNLHVRNADHHLYDETISLIRVVYMFSCSSDDFMDMIRVTR